MIHLQFHPYTSLGVFETGSRPERGREEHSEMGDAVLKKHKKALISRMLWKVTEANGKYTTRYCSVKALEVDKEEKRHDHVLTRKQMVARILADPIFLESEIDKALGCTVTKDEHDALRKFDSSCDGWERYRRARILVWDMKDNKLLFEV